ncbi:MAG TPA: MmcQ/YjbR family DNA-binding protein, partial [Ignavibacteriaceae bacterium]
MLKNTQIYNETRHFKYYKRWMKILFLSSTIILYRIYLNIMNIDQIREHCLKKKGVTEEFPFDEETLVFKVAGKIFLLASLESIPLQINLKCEPEKALEL